MFIQPEAISSTRRAMAQPPSKTEKPPCVRKATKPDPLVKLLGKYKTLTAEVQKTAAVMAKAERLLLKDNAKHPAIHAADVLDNDIDVRIMTGYGAFSWAPKIKRAITHERRCFTMDIKQVRADARRPGPLQTESKLQLVRLKAKLARLPEIEKKLLTALAKDEKRVDRLQRAVRWDEKLLAYGQAYRELWTTFEKINNTEIKSREGALALIEVTAVMLQAGVMVATQLPLILDRARRYLSTKNT